MTDIPTLYRALKCESAMRNHLQGMLDWIRHSLLSMDPI